MYNAFFGLRDRPFDLAPDPRFLFLTAPQHVALSTLRYGLMSQRGLALLIGEAGTGKTTLIHAVLAELGTGVLSVLMDNPRLTRQEFYEYLAEGFHFGTAAAQSKTQFLTSLRRLLEERHAAGQHTALILDEAQSLSYELLEEVRLLSNIETPTTKLLNVILAGQQELAERLNEPELRQLKQRISLRAELTPFDEAATSAYVAGRLRIAGGSPATIFSREAVQAIHPASGGVPRLINVLCDNALINGFAAQVRPVTRALVEEVIRDFDMGNLRDVTPLRPEVAKASAIQSAARDQDARAESPDADPPLARPALFEFSTKRRRFSFF
jgi:type II secretory pathway predicted ATPase ExeA